MFGKSFEDSVNGAVEKVRGSFPGTNISATVAGKVVTLKGEAPDIDTKGRIMAAFNKLVETENTLNQISIPKAAAAASPAAAKTDVPAAMPSGGTVHEVVKGETLSAIAKKYYGNANKYMKIFEANKNILSDPDKIKPGQKLTIPA